MRQQLAEDPHYVSDILEARWVSSILSNPENLIAHHHIDRHLIDYQHSDESKILTETETFFFENRIFRNQYFFPRLNFPTLILKLVSETNTETFFLRPNFPRKRV